MKRQIPYHGWCFVCGNENPRSIGITMFVDDDRVLTSEFTLNKTHQGPPGHAHGGATAAILDEVMGLVVWAAGYKVVAVNIDINYYKMLPLEQPILAVARITEVGERKVISTGELRLADSTVAVSGSGVYVIAPQLFKKSPLEGVHS
ncbi:MAG: PaaI family thioesterase [Chloroflexi bacterium]|nr:PaaI family thioesterase [Chloroflexota bacterium]MBI3167378.1 PaaI family thioesterase [Chloroflexota bacterium]